MFASSFIILYRELKVGQTWGSWNISMLIAELHLCKAGFSLKWRIAVAICCLCMQQGSFWASTTEPELAGAWVHQCLSDLFGLELSLTSASSLVSSSRGYSWWVLTYRLSFLCFGDFFWLFSFCAIKCSWVIENHSYSNLRVGFKPFQWFQCVYMTCQVWFNVFSEPVRDTNLLIVTLNCKDFLTCSAAQSTRISGWLLLLRVSPNFCSCVILFEDTFCRHFHSNNPIALCFV